MPVYQNMGEVTTENWAQHGKRVETRLELDTEDLAEFFDQKHIMKTIDSSFDGTEQVGAGKRVNQINEQQQAEQEKCVEP